MPSRKRRVRQAEIVRAFAERLKTTRLARGMTQRQLADQANVTFSYISRLEAGGAAPGIDLLDRLARALKADIRDLLPPPATAEEPGGDKERVKRLFETLLPKVGPEALGMLEVFLARLADAPSHGR